MFTFLLHEFWNVLWNKKKNDFYELMLHKLTIQPMFHKKIYFITFYLSFIVHSLFPVLVFMLAIEFSIQARNGISTPNWCCVPLSTSTKWVWFGSKKLSFGLCFFPSLYEAGHFPRHWRNKSYQFIHQSFRNETF